MLRAWLVIALVLGGASAVLLLQRVPEIRDVAFWERHASPGLLSAAHADLEDRCSSCHTPLRGVEPSSCIVCHANETALLQRQATAFHASVGACPECHREHLGRQPAPMAMDHGALAAIGLRALGRGEPGSEERELYHRIVRASPAVSGAFGSRLTPLESALDCRTCHASKDRHWGFFGTDCAQCHSTEQWTIAEFRHPPPSSLDCAQCHQAPPSHFMEHFHMISMRVAGQEHAEVAQCYLCHQTTAWNDIRGAGVYKHH